MTDDDFTEAARAEAMRQYPALNPDTGELTYPRSALREHKRSAYVAGWEAARTHLTEREVSDAEWENEVAAALPERYDGDEDQRAIILRAVKDMAARDAPEPTDAAQIIDEHRTTGRWVGDGVRVECTCGHISPGSHPGGPQTAEDNAHRDADRKHAAHVADVLARAARRDEEKQDG